MLDKLDEDLSKELIETIINEVNALKNKDSEVRIVMEELNTIESGFKTLTNYYEEN